MISIFILGTISVASGFEAGIKASYFPVPQFSSLGRINSNTEVSEVKSDLASVKSRQDETDEKLEKILEQMKSLKSCTKGEEVSEMKSELTSFGLRQKETETKLQDISSKVDRAMKTLKTDVSNLALRKPAYGSRDWDQYSNPNHVVDGDKHGIRIRDQCFTSAESRPWWMVDLQDIYDIYNVTLYRRTEGYAFRFRDLEILVYKENPMENNSSQTMTCAQKKGQLSRPEVLTCNPLTTGRFVLLRYIPPTKAILTVCEVEVRGKLFKG
ncbi:fucolectin-7-like [Haliotis rufescens]|uniref:fucolectin-7-like n=1 Tax=Haliotis rufescens TaxID=6454 RepID=UPI00201E9C57|nr:fucolectin-7-like [Haliotis rufescens]